MGQTLSVNSVCWTDTFWALIHYRALCLIYYIDLNSNERAHIKMLTDFSVVLSTTELIMPLHLPKHSRAKSQINDNSGCLGDEVSLLSILCFAGPGRALRNVRVLSTALKCCEKQMSDVHVDNALAWSKIIDNSWISSPKSASERKFSFLFLSQMTNAISRHWINTQQILSTGMCHLCWPVYWQQK